MHLCFSSGLVRPEGGCSPAIAPRETNSSLTSPGCAQARTLTLYGLAIFVRLGPKSPQSSADPLNHEEQMGIISICFKSQGIGFNTLSMIKQFGCCQPSAPTITRKIWRANTSKPRGNDFRFRVPARIPRWLAQPPIRTSCFRVSTPSRYAKQDLSGVALGEDGQLFDEKFLRQLSIMFPEL
jgi:hypothetical protein